MTDYQSTRPRLGLGKGYFHGEGECSLLFCTVEAVSGIGYFGFYLVCKAINKCWWISLTVSYFKTDDYEAR